MQKGLERLSNHRAATLGEEFSPKAGIIHLMPSLEFAIACRGCGS